MARIVLFPALSLILSLACTHAPRNAAKGLAAPTTATATAPATDPEADRDGDGFLDSVDRCADDPGVEPDGCPIPDTDGDGILDPDDKCPTEPETRNGYQDEDGCPDQIPTQLAKFSGTIKGVYFGSEGGKAGKPRQRPAPPETVASGERYAHIAATGFVKAARDRLATFAADVDTAAYSNMRRFLLGGDMPPTDAVRIEEYINYFDYAYPQPTGDEAFAVYSEVGPCPWNPKHRLVHLGVQAKIVQATAVPPRNLVFLIDVSGSMHGELELLKVGFHKLIDQFRPEDRVAIVVYAGAAGVVLEPTSGSEQAKVRAALDRLEAGGSTAGGEGIALAYALAGQNVQKNAINRVILATDGDFNVGVQDTPSLVKLVRKHHKHGIQLTVLGFGEGNIGDETMEGLADQGDGNYAYIDSAAEADKVLVREVGSTLVTVARDVKLQVAWNPKRVASYRQIGYDNRQLADRDFRNDKKDAGEVGSGHAVTALFEVVPTDGQAGDELLTLSLRSKSPAGKPRPEQTVRVADPGPRELAATSVDFRFSAAVAEFGLLLRDDAEKAATNFPQVLELARGSLGPDPHGDRKQFITLVGHAEAGFKRAAERRAADAALAERRKAGFAQWKREEAERTAKMSKAIKKASEITAAAVPVIERAADVMREFPTIRVEISGHSDSQEGSSPEERLAMSRARAEAVKAYMVGVEGIDPSRIEVRGAGPEEPIDTNKTAAGRAKNRRIEFTILVQ